MLKFIVGQVQSCVAEIREYLVTRRRGVLHSRSVRNSFPGMFKRWWTVSEVFGAVARKDERQGWGNRTSIWKWKVPALANLGRGTRADSRN